MKQFSKFCLLIFSIGFFNSSIVQAQKSSAKKYIQEDFHLNEGTLSVFLPSDLRAGDVISGTVVVWPDGNNEKQKNRNAKSLKKYSLVVGGIPIQFEKSSTNNIHFSGKLTKLNMQVENEKIGSFSSKAIPALPIPQQPVAFGMPTHALTDAPFSISGAFDGEAANTVCRLDGKTIEVLAESPRQTICQMPAATSGAHELSIEENGQSTTKNIAAVNMNLSTGKLNLQKGESTFVNVAISGLQNLPGDATLTVTNTSTGTVTMQGGNAQIIPITPAAAESTGNFSRRFNLQSIKTGSFTVSVDLDLPASDNTSHIGTASAALCNCYINEHSYLLPPSICASLGGSVNTPAENTNTTAPIESVNPPVVQFSQPEEINAETGPVNLQLLAPDNDIAAVIFSDRHVADKDWTPIGTATQDGNNWRYDWLTPVGNDGEHIVRARIVSKNNVVTERFINKNIQLNPSSINPLPGENIALTITSSQIRDADWKVKGLAEKLRQLQEKLDKLQKEYNDLKNQQAENTNMANELEEIDKVIEKIPGLYKDSLQKLTDSLNNLKKKLPKKVDTDALQKAANDAAQRAKDCKDRLDKLKQDRDKAKKDLDDLNKKIEDLLNQMDQLHLGNNWVGGHGYHADGGFWYGYVGDERSNTNISPQANNLANQLRALKRPQNEANNRLNNLNNDIKNAENDCDKLQKEKEKADEALKNGKQHDAVETQINELDRQIKDLMSSLEKWCAAHPGVCNFDPALPESPTSPQALQAYLNKLNEIIEKKKQKEKDLKNAATQNGDNAAEKNDEIKSGNDKKETLENDKTKAQEEADKLKAQREKQLEEEREKLRKKQEEERIKRNTPKPAPTLPTPIDPTEKQIKYQAISLFRSLYNDAWIKYGPCDCRTKALALSNNTNKAATQLVFNIGLGVIFAPLEAFPGLSLATKLGLGAVKALGSALYGGEDFTNELAKNLFNVIGGEIFPKLTGSDIAGKNINKFAGKGLDALLKDEGVKSFSWEGETTLRNCGKVKGKTTTLFNANTGWVTMLIKIEGCPLVVVKYKVNKDGVPLSNPTPVVKQIR